MEVFGFDILCFSRLLWDGVQNVTILLLLFVFTPSSNSEGLPFRNLSLLLLLISYCYCVTNLFDVDVHMEFHDINFQVLVGYNIVFM